MTMCPRLCWLGVAAFHGYLRPGYTIWDECSITVSVNIQENSINMYLNVTIDSFPPNINVNQSPQRKTNWPTQSSVE